MKKFKVKVDDTFNGQRLGVQFKDGEAVAELQEGEDAVLKSWGYEVEEIVEEKEAPKEEKKAPKKAPAKKAPKKTEK